MTPKAAALAVVVLAILALTGTVGKFAYDSGYWSGYNEMKSALDAANAQFIKESAAVHDHIRRLDEKLVAAHARNKQLEEQADAAIDDAKNKVPLSEACNACRVPAARIHGGLPRQ